VHEDGAHAFAGVAGLMRGESAYPSPVAQPAYFRREAPGEFVVNLASCRQV